MPEKSLKLFISRYAFAKNFTDVDISHAV